MGEKGGWLITRDPCKVVALVPSKGVVERLPFSREEVELLFSYFERCQGREREWGRAMVLGLMSGSRLGDVISAPLSDFGLREGRWVFSYRAAKTGRWVEVPLMLEGSAFDFCRGVKLGQKSGVLCPRLFAEWERMGNADLSSDFVRIIKKAGVVVPVAGKEGGRQIARKSFHSLRHTLKVLLDGVGATREQSNMILGWSGAQGEAYSHADLAVSEEVLKKVFLHGFTG